jgi:amino-acid racemase
LIKLLIDKQNKKPMKTIGLIGGMSWESTVSYYQILNESVGKRLGGLHSAKILLYSVDFDPIEKLQHQDKWKETADILCDAAIRLEKGGADFLLICTNTMHKVEPEVSAAVTIPLLHIADATAEDLLAQKIKKVGLLGTAFTMEQDFYKGRLREKYGLEVITPDKQEREQVHTIIYKELCLGTIKDSSRDTYLDIINNLESQGAEAVILGCTEIALLVGSEKTGIPLFDTTRIHAEKAVDLALDCK